METPMTAAELKGWLSARSSSSSLIVVPELRENMVKMRTQLPSRWVGLPSSAGLQATAQPGEHFSFQLTVVNLENEGVTAAVQLAQQPFCVPQTNLKGSACA
jgi:hypothetical protein